MKRISLSFLSLLPCALTLWVFLFSFNFLAALEIAGFQRVVIEVESDVPYRIAVTPKGVDQDGIRHYELAVLSITHPEVTISILRVSSADALDSLQWIDGKGQQFRMAGVFRSVGSGAYAVVRVFQFDGKTMTMTDLPEPDAELMMGYGGGDRYNVKGKLLERTFPVYRVGDATGFPTGGRLTLIYDFQKNTWSEGNRMTPPRR